MAEITYLLGAGASYGALPIVSEMHERINETINWFQIQCNDVYPTLIVNRQVKHPNEKNQIDTIISDLKWLRDICNTFVNFSVDTYARKLNISGNEDEYIKLKNVLSLYFTLEQRRKFPDVRYDNFWASILKQRTKFPNNIKIISWNYDFQLELTYQDFFGHDSLKVARETMNISSLETDLINIPDSGQFGIFKLNGSATFNSTSIYNSDTNYFIDKFKTSTINDFLAGVFEVYNNLCSKNKIYKNHISFAWEHQRDSHFYKNLKESICNTEVLVVIGYSFPFFNRDIDKLILREFMGDRLKKVYFQSHPKDVEDVRERFLAIRDDIGLDKLLLRSDIQQFTLPNEL